MQGLAVRAALAGYDEGGAGEGLVKVAQIQHALNARIHDGPGIGHESSSKPACSTGAGPRKDIHARLFPHLRCPLQHFRLQDFHMGRGGPFLRAEQTNGARGTRQRNLHVAQKLHLRLPQQLPHTRNREHSPSAIAGDRPSQANDKPPASPRPCGKEQFPHATGIGLKRIALLRFYQLDATGLRHLQNGGIVPDAVAGLDPSVQRIVHLFRDDGTPERPHKHFQRAFSAIGQGNLHNFRLGKTHPQGRCQHLGYLAGSQALLERIWCDNNFHLGRYTNQNY